MEFDTIRPKFCSVFVIYLLSNLFLLIIPAALLLSSGYAVNRSIDTSLNEANQLITRQFQQVMDNAFNEMNEIHRSLFTDQRIQNYLYTGLEQNDYNRYTGVQIKERLASILSSKTFVSFFYVYFPASSSVISPSYRLDAQTFYARLFQYEGLDYEQWRSALKRGYTSFQFLDFKMNAVDAGGQTDYLTFCKTLYQTGDPELNPVVVCFLPKTQLEETADSIFGDSGIAVEIWQGDTLISKAGMDIQPANNRLVLSSDVMDLTYRIEIGGNPVLNGFSGVSRFIAVSAAIGFGVNLLLAWLFAYHNYSPIRYMAKRLTSQEEGVGSKRPQNELQLIEWNFQNTLEQSHAMQNKLQKISPVYINHYLGKLIHGTVPDLSVSAETLAAYGIEVISDRYCIAEMSINHPGEFDYNGSEKERGLVHMLIKNVADELFAKLAEVHFVYYEDSVITMILNLYPACDFQIILAALRRMHSIFAADFAISLSFFVSDTVEGLSEVPMAYDQTQYAMQLNRFKGIHGVTAYREVLHDKLGFVSYSIDDEIQLINFVRAGDQEQMIQKLEGLISENLERRVPSANSVQFFLINLVATFSKAAQQFGFDPDQLENTPLRPVESFRSTEEVRNHFVTLYSRLALHTASHMGGKYGPLLQKLEELIEQQYVDANLSVAMLADQVGLNPSYLSTVFKEQTGTNISDHIHEVRLRHAKRLLCGEGVTLTDVAAAAGYHSDASFIRAFKKYEGVTPGVYRKMRRSEENPTNDQLSEKFDHPNLRIDK